MAWHGCLPHWRPPLHFMFMSFGSLPCALSTRDPLHHILESPNFQELSSQPPKNKEIRGGGGGGQVLHNSVFEAM